MISCIAIDDEPMALEVIERYCDKTDLVQLKATFREPLKAIEYLNSEQADLIFLDINMPDISGMQLLQTLPAKPMVIFTTAYSNYAVESYELNAVDYLLKPIAFDRFFKAAQKAQGILRPVATIVAAPEPPPAAPQPQQDFSNDFIFVKSEYKIQKVYLNQILYIEGLKDYISIFTDTERIITLQNMKKMEETLPENHFVRVHKSYIVALSKIDSIERSRISIGDKVIPIGDTYRDHFFKLIDGKNV